MTTPPSSPSPTGLPRQAHGHAWIAARAALAARRSASFAKAWGITLGTLTLLALGISLFSGDPASAGRAASGQLAADTLRSAQRLREAGAAVGVADSVHRAARAQAAASPVAGAQSRQVAVTAAVTATVPATSQSFSPAVTELSARIARARRERTVAAWISVSEDPVLSKGPRMRSLADSMRSYDARTRTIATDADSVVRRQGLQARIDRAGNTIIAIAENRRLELEARVIADVSVAPSSPVVETATAPPARLIAPDTIATSSARRSSQESLASAQRAHDSLTKRAIAQLTVNDPGSRGPSLASASPAIALASLLVLGVLMRFATALSREINAPMLADASEAERLVRAPVLTTVREAMLAGPARFHPSGIDPFRILYLGLTATGTRVRTAIVTGADPVIAAATGARLAIAAAADHRQTLIVDLDVANIPLSRTFRERAEPGMSDALARAFTWREVARPVGSSDGLTITLLPAGTDREDLASGAELEELRESFVRLRANYELTIIVAPPSRVAFAALLVEAAPVILTVVAGATPLADLESLVAVLRSASHRIQGLVLWDAARPELPSRAELAALLSKRKGRTPGGSFEAAQRAIDPKTSNSNRT